MPQAPQGPAPKSPNASKDLFKSQGRVHPLMSEITIENPRLRLRSKSAQSQLEVNSSIQLILPQELQGISSSEELLQLVSSGKLWIARVGSCSLTVEATTLGSALSRVETSLVEDWMSSHPLWEQLGVRLVSLRHEPALSTNEIGLSIQHPDLTSALVAPTNALVAEFVSARCAIDLSITKRYNTANKTTHTPPHESSDEETPNDHETVHHGVDIDDQRAVMEFMTHLHQCEEQDPRPRRVKRRRISETQHRIENIGLHKNAIDAALRSIMLGGSKTGNSHRPLDRVVAPGLSQLAPGVFHVPYTQVISERASLCTTISSSLARMSGAESPSLRRKLYKFQTSRTSETNGVPPESNILQNIEKSVWEIILKYSKSSLKGKRKPVGPLTPAKPTQQPRGAQQPNSVSNVSFSPPTSPSPPTMEIWDHIQTTESDERLSLPTLGSSAHTSGLELASHASDIHEYLSSLSQTLWYKPPSPSRSQLGENFGNESSS